MENEESTKKKIKHRRSEHFQSVFAGGTVVSKIERGPTYTLTFYEDVVGINSETILVSEDGVASTGFETGDLDHHREDKVRVTIREDGLIALRDLINRLLTVGSNEQQ